MALPLALMGVGAGVGMLGNYFGAKEQNKPQWQQTTPWDSGQADQWKGMMGNSLANFGNLNYGPTDAQNWMFGRMGNSAFGGGGGGKTKGINTANTDYEKKVLSDYYLDLENNPYHQGYLDSMQAENTEALGRAQAETVAPFVGAGGTMGMSGINAATRQGVADDYGENLGNQIAQYNAAIYGQERGLQDAANQAHSQREGNWDASMIGADVTGYGHWADAQTAMRNQDMLGEYYKGSLGLQGANQKWGQQMDMWGMGEQMRQLGLQGQGLGEYGMLSDYGRQMLPYQQGFGKTTMQGPQVSPFGSALQGAFGGAASGLGMGHTLGDMNINTWGQLFGT